jgi:hypothetical protein
MVEDYEDRLQRRSDHEARRDPLDRIAEHDADDEEHDWEEGPSGYTEASQVDEEGTPCVRTLEGHSKSVTALYYEDGCLVSASWVRSAMVFARARFSTQRHTFAFSIIVIMIIPPTAWQDHDLPGSAVQSLTPPGHWFLRQNHPAMGRRHRAMPPHHGHPLGYLQPSSGAVRSAQTAQARPPIIYVLWLGAIRRPPPFLPYRLVAHGHVRRAAPRRSDEPELCGPDATVRGWLLGDVSGFRGRVAVLGLCPGERKRRWRSEDVG